MRMRATSGSRRRRSESCFAGLHDPMLAVATSDVQPLPHQIRAVYGELLPRTHCGSCSPTILGGKDPSWPGFTSRS